MPKVFEKGTPRIAELVSNPPQELTCGSVFSLFARFMSNNNAAILVFTANEGGGQEFTYVMENVNSLRDLAEKIRMTLFAIDCDLSWNGEVTWTHSFIQCQAANCRNWKTDGNFTITKWSTGGKDWEV